MTEPRYILTIATGKKLYLDLALNLARSFFFWHPGTAIQFQLATDQRQLVSEDIIEKVGIIDIKPGEFGEGFSPKLFLDRLANKGQTLFIDSDCLIFGNLDSVFGAFKGHKVSVIGNYISEGEWFGDVKKICTEFKVPRLPKFNGGIYYLEKSVEADKVYERARDIEKRYDEIGFIRLRNRPNDEVIMALAMQLEGMEPVIDDGSVMSDPQACPGKYQLDIIKGKTSLINPAPPHPEHRAWYPFGEVYPLVVHFLGSYTQDYPYRREVYRLKKAQNNELNWFSNLKGILTIEFPERIKSGFKNMFRNSYHKFFGVRKVKASERVVTN